MKTIGTLLILTAAGFGTYFGYQQWLKKNPPLAGEPAQKGILEEVFDVAFEKIRASDIYQKSGATKRAIIDSTLATITANKQVQQNLKIYSDINNIQIEDAIVSQLLPSGK